MHGFYYIDSSLLQNAYTINAVIEEDLPVTIYRDIADIIINDWPGELWFVEVITLAVSLDNTLQAIKFKLIKKLPSSLLFGSCGENICCLLESIDNLSLQQVEQLAILATPMAEEAYSRAWNSWLMALEGKDYNVHLESDHRGTLAIGQGIYSSPIYSGFLLIDLLVNKKARLLAGDVAIITQTLYGETVAQLSPLWSQACSVLLQAAMGLGAASYIAPYDLELLLAGWNFLENNS